MVILVTITLLIFLKVSGISIIDLLNSEKETSVKLPQFSYAALAWAVPLYCLLEAINFIIIYFSLKSAYPEALGKKLRRESEEKAALSERSLPASPVIKKSGDGAPKGFWYLELSQNKLFVLLACIIPFACLLLPFAASMLEVSFGNINVQKMFETANSPMVLLLTYVLGFLGANACLSGSFGNENKKLWACFVVSTPGGKEAYVKNKYIFCFFINMLFHISFYIAGTLLATVTYFATGNEVPSYYRIYLFGVYLFLFLSATDLPLTFRFGAKRASMIKVSAIMALMIILTVIFSFLPENTQEKIMIGLTGIFSLNINLSEKTALAFAFFPFLTVIFYLLSARISQTLYLKGAE